jgi:hypothetical protein
MVLKAIIIYFFILFLFFIFIFLLFIIFILKVDFAAPEIIFRRDRVSQLCCGTNHSAFVTDTGILYCFGKGTKNDKNNLKGNRKEYRNK